MKKLMISLALVFVFLSFTSTASFAAQWYRGNLHMHSYWSDGGVFPEEAVSLYRDAGYNFVCLSDHNGAQSNEARYREISEKGKRMVRPSSIERFQKRYPNYPVEIQKRVVDGVEKEFVRLKTFKEFQKLVEIPDRFIVIPGFEPSGGAKNGKQVHSNIINTEGAFPFESLEDEHKTMDAVCKRAELLRRGREKETIFFLNHPDWIYYDVVPEMIIKRPDYRFFEVINCGPNFPGPKCAWTTDKFWDVVNAHRAEDGGTLLYGIGSDDTHGYNHFYDNPKNSGDGYIMVRAEKLTTANIIEAMYRGDFYVSNGVRLKDIQFDKATKTLTVEVDAKEGVEYTINFIGTKKGFDRKTTTFEEPASKTATKKVKPARTFSIYSDEIGQTLKSVKATSASFKMTDDLLYVRAKIVSNKTPVRIVRGKPLTETAWTQPVR
ncbi:MAG: hypothetical protein PHQ75_00700 [Thermoguttaceae bacterium]|nr:hypothetical protein [Thermoguttaceae bacterium]